MENTALINMIKNELKNHCCDVCNSRMLVLERLEWVDKDLKGVTSCVQCDNWQAVKFNIYQVIDTQKPTARF